MEGSTLSWCNAVICMGVAISPPLAPNAEVQGGVFVEPKNKMTELQRSGGDAVPGAMPRPVTTDSKETVDRVGSPLTQSDIGRLIEKEYVGLRLLISRRAGDPQVAADILNDALCIAWERWCAGQIARPELICGYVFQVAINLLHNRSRSVADRPDRRADIEHIDAFHFTTDSTNREIEASMAAKVRRFVSEMSSPRDRTVLVRFYLNEDDKGAICSDMGLSPLQFDKILHRARGRLRKLFETAGIRGSEMLCAVFLL
jgi:RNA polymerase sigma-70 factor (ECF subfamily)